MRDRDGGTFPGYVRAASENWGGAPPVRTRANGSILRLRPLSVRFGGPLAILGIQQPKIFVRGRRFSFWGGLRGISAENRAVFYTAVGKPPSEVFPIRFCAASKLSTGILSGKLEGFYRGSLDGKPPQIDL